MAYLLAQAKQHGCTCVVPNWGTWAEVQARWDTIDPSHRDKLEWYRANVASEDDMVLLDHETTCPRAPSRRGVDELGEGHGT